MARAPAHFVPAKRAAAERGLPYSSLRAAAFRGELNPVQMGSPTSRRRAWYFDDGELDRWIEAQRMRPASGRGR